MDINDLKSFLVIARHQNLRSAAHELHQTASALSKAIRRLEESLHTDLFDRHGKSLQLNADGEFLRVRAEALVNLAEQTRAEFRGERQQIHCRIVAPAILQWRFGSSLSAQLRQQFPGSGIAFTTAYEDAALAFLVKGSADFAIITDAAIQSGLPAGVEKWHLGSIQMRLASSIQHPLFKNQAPKATKPLRELAKARPARRFSMNDILQFDFACPPRSMICGLERGARSDGWRDDQIPRRIRFWIDELQLLVQLVQSGQALAYLPDFILEAAHLEQVKLKDCPYECVEQCWLVWRPAAAYGWQNQLMNKLQR